MHLYDYCNNICNYSTVHMQWTHHKYIAGKSQPRRPVSAENLPKDFSKIMTYSTGTLLPVPCAMAAGSGT